MASPMPSLDRREHRAHAPLPSPRNPYLACMHADPYCTVCAREGQLLLRNIDVERSSWFVSTNGARA